MKTSSDAMDSASRGGTRDNNRNSGRYAYYDTESLNSHGHSDFEATETDHLQGDFWSKGSRIVPSLYLWNFKQEGTQFRRVHQPYSIELLGKCKWFENQSFFQYIHALTEFP